MADVSVRELKAHLTRYLRRLESGEQLTVTRRGRPVAVLSGVACDGAAAEVMRPLVAKGLVSWSGRKAVLPRRRPTFGGSGPTIADMVLEDRR